MALRDERISHPRSSSIAASKGPTATAQHRSSSRDASPMHAERLKNLYAAMLKCRALAALLDARVSDQVCCRGYEAIIAGAAIHLRREDFVAPSRAELFARFVQGVFTDALAPSNHGAATNVNAATRLSSASAAVNIATGMALACKLQQNRLVTLSISFGSDTLGAKLEALSFAAARNLPIVFVTVEDVSRAHSAVTELPTETKDVLPVITVDGSDVVAVYRVAEECTRRARQGHGASLIECRMDAAREPILFMESYLKQRDLWSESLKQNLERESAREAKVIVTKYLRPSTREGGPVSTG
jgi:TPP-dependent pyruvate/acetoin dehydrogenase alpha subunit